MNDISMHHRATLSAPLHGPEAIDLRRLVRSAWSLVPLTAASVLACLALGVVYLAFAQPGYVASSDLLIGGVSSSPTVEVSALPDAIVSDSELLSQVEIVRSQDLALKVVDELGLADDAPFLDQPAPLVERLKVAAKVALGLEEATGPPSQMGAAARRGYAASLLRRNLDVSRVGRTYVISIGYAGPTAERTYRIAAAYTDAYARDRQEANVRAAATRAAWLADGTRELEGRLEAIDAAAQRVRVEAGLTSVGDVSVLERQLADLATLLSGARARVARASAALESLQAEPAEAGTGTSDAAAPLEADIARLEEDRSRIEAQFGPDHPRIAVIDAALANLRAQAARRRSGLLAAARSELAAARREEASLAARLADVTGDNARANDGLARVGSLTRKAEALRATYDTLSARAEDAARRGRHTSPAVRILSRASKPTDPSTPRTVPTLALSFLGGLALSGLLLALGWLREPVIAVGRDVHEQLGLPFLGTLAPGRESGAGTMEAVRRAFDHAVPRDPAGDPPTLGLSFAASDPDVLRQELAVLVGRTLPPQTKLVTIPDWDRWADVPGPSPTRLVALVLPAGRIAGSAVKEALAARPDWTGRTIGVVLCVPPGRGWLRRRRRHARRLARRRARSMGAASQPRESALDPPIRTPTHPVGAAPPSP